MGTVVCVADRIALEDFKASWKYHNKLSEEQFQYADRVTTVAAVGFYHGGDPLYTLKGIPGLWHEQCLLTSA